MSMSEYLLTTVRAVFSRLKLRLALLTVLTMPLSVAAQGPKLGVAVDEATIAAMDISVMPDGKNLPAGSGSVGQGKEVYDARCANCHGVDGAGGEGLADPLVGGIDSLNTDAPMKTVGSYWPFATTLFDYIRRAMPLDAPLLLTDDEVYAVSAYILSSNGIIEADTTLDATSLPAVQMPNRDGFVSKWPGYTH